MTRRDNNFFELHRGMVKFLPQTNIASFDLMSYFKS